jgi:hypothetical protein
VDLESEPDRHVEPDTNAVDRPFGDDKARSGFDWERADLLKLRVEDVMKPPIVQVEELARHRRSLRWRRGRSLTVEMIQHRSAIQSSCPPQVSPVQRGAGSAGRLAAMALTKPSGSAIANQTPCVGLPRPQLLCVTASPATCIGGRCSRRVGELRVQELTHAATERYGVTDGPRSA